MTIRIVLAIFTLFLSSAVYCSEASAPDNAILTAQYALFEGEPVVAEQLLAGYPQSRSLALQQLQVRLWTRHEETDKASELLSKLQKQHKRNADLHYFAGGIWRALGHQVSVFSKISYYRRGVEAYIRAGQLAPDNPKYLRKQASVYGQSDMMGGDSKKQRPMLAKIEALDTQYGLVAAMDLAQNEQNSKLSAQLAEQAVSRFPDSFLLLERAAKMHSTLKNKRRAQQLYARACQLPAQSGPYRMTWISSCYHVVQLADKAKNYGLAVTAMQNLLRVNRLATSENDQARVYLAKMEASMHPSH
ncbi:MAG: hypothetical protein MJK04_22480 [Psychrosphaera sp.]|nr:hypothetical protein [Psychrosphaera sp.]